MANAVQYLEYKGFKRRSYPGLGHVVASTQILLHEATLLDRVAVLPPLEVNLLHNRGVRISTQWQRYFDFKPLADLEVKCCFEPPEGLKKSRISGKTPHRELVGHTAPYIVRLFPDAAMFGEWMPEEFIDPVKGIYRQGYGPLPSLFDLPSREVLEIVEPLAKRMHPYYSLHVRRNDAADERTSGSAILAHIKSLGIPEGSRIFILSDERNPDHFSACASSYELFLECEIPELVDVWDRTRDNYLVFMAARILRRYAEKDLGEMRFLDAARSSSSLISTWKARLSSLLGIKP